MAVGHDLEAFHLEAFHRGAFRPEAFLDDHQGASRLEAFHQGAFRPEACYLEVVDLGHFQVVPAPY